MCKLARGAFSRKGLLLLTSPDEDGGGGDELFIRRLSANMHHMINPVKENNKAPVIFCAHEQLCVSVRQESFSR
jgi:hypothetical protein